MLHRLLSILLILTLVCAEIPAILPCAFAEEMEVADDEAYSYILLKKGDRDGEDSANIVILQNRLIELGYLRDAADGVFGANTEEAILALQRSNGLEATGQADPALQEWIYSDAEIIGVEKSTDPQSVAYRVQEALSLWGFLTDDPDGKIGSKTTEAIASFKEYLRADYWNEFPTPKPEATPAPAVESSGYGDAAIAIDVPLRQDNDGEIDDVLLSYVNGDYSFETYRRTLSNGDSGNEVLRVQRRLNQLNYLPIVDGAYGADTERALLYFQKKNGLEQTAVADEVTQRLLFSDAAVESEEFICAYKYVVDISEQMVYAYQWNGSNYGICVREMICSTGKNATPTPLGTYQAAGITGTGEWYWFSEFECYAKWATRIVGGILFHSVTYSRGKSLNRGSVSHLGRKASHGCIRLKVEDAKWVYEHCPEGTTVLIQE